MCITVEAPAADREPHRKDNVHFKCKAKCCTFCSYCAQAFSKERNKSRGSRLLLQEKYIKTCEKCFLCHAIVLCNSCLKCSICCHKSACRGQTSKVLEKLVRSGCRIESGSNPERGLHPPLSDPAELVKNTHSHKLLWQSSQKSQTVRGITSAYGQECHRTSSQKGLTRFLQPTIFSPKTRQQVKTDLRPKQSESFPQDRKIQDGDTGNHQNISPKGRMGNLHRLQGRLLPHSNTGTVQEVPPISYPGADLPVQSTAVRSVDSSHGVYYCSKGGKADGQRYKVDWLVRATSHQVCLQHTQVLIKMCRRLGWLVNVEKSELEPKQVFNFVGYQFDLESGRVRPTPDWWQNLQDKILALISLPEFMSLIGLLTATEKQVHLGRLHMRPIQWHLKSNWRIPESLEKRIPLPRSLQPHLQWWLKEDNVLTGQPLHPIQHALQIFTDASKEGWGAHLNEFTARGDWSLPESKLHINYLELKAVLLALKEFKISAWAKWFL